MFIADSEHPARIPTKDLGTEWHVASVAIHTRPEALGQTVEWLEHRPRTEVHAQSQQGKLVVVTESDDPQDILDLIDDAIEQPGVVNASLVYHEVIPSEEASE